MAKVTAKLDVKAKGLALSLTLGVIYIVCVLLFAIAPVFAINFFNLFTHGIDLTAIAKTGINPLSAFVGFILTLIFGYIIGAIYAAFYNRFAK